MKVAILFAQKFSVYRGVSGVEVYDQKRDARSFTGGMPVVAHPPCRSFGRLRHLAKHAGGDFELARLAISAVRWCGGVVEHPEFSLMWPAFGLPFPGRVDDEGGWTLALDQLWFGHRAQKRTWLYINGVRPDEVPQLPYSLAYAAVTVDRLGREERERTPSAFALWLVELARRCRGRQGVIPGC